MRTAILMALLLVLCACAAPAGDAEPVSGPTTSGETLTATTGGTLTGVLGGDADLEGGCVWLETGDGRRVEVVWPDGYRTAVDPVALRDEDGGIVAAEGDTVTIRGAPAADRVSTCQIGEIWTATAIDDPAGR